MQIRPALRTTLFPYTTLFRSTKTGSTLKIMDLATKGEQPFANLIREQFVNQVGKRLLALRRRSEEHTSELQSRPHLVCRLLLEKKNTASTMRNYERPLGSSQP